MNTPYIQKTIILAGATGDLGQRIAGYLVKSGAGVQALIRPESKPEEVALLHTQGVRTVEVDFNDHNQLVEACRGGSCVVSALSGLADVIVNLQTRLALAAIEAGVPRFIPSDYCIEYTKLPEGSNRNLDLRRQFNERIDNLPIAATSILNGMFTDLLTGQAPVILFGLKRIAYWGSANQLLDFTTIDNTAAYTAMAAMDTNTPRYLRIAGDVMSISGLQLAASEATGNKFKRLRVGGLGALQAMIRITRAIMPQKKEVFPPWQGMQYLHNMLSGLPKLAPLDNSRYPEMSWTTVQEVLSRHVSKIPV